MTKLVTFQNPDEPVYVIKDFPEGTSDDRIRTAAEVIARQYVQKNQCGQADPEPAHLKEIDAMFCCPVTIEDLPVGGFCLSIPYYLV